ncbi:MAG: YfhO family protein [Prolixibacteraceae bacterium]|nr:YfhO family protein [Prolixibacteraceae bacterium]MBT6007270.1 YfhO family protein [Prolixibacteraceae bacterium]MBT6767139.1 YfhO family protein [Prolixibacteraceae bacterium]MBT7000519.1 YfhO family protein [Prolixibacteraceae bacterium]MBT7393467.1 YfhO family protein [Prolixibacteraceae bacterium]
MKKIISSNPIGINIFIIVIIISISFIYFSPQIEGKILEQSDITHFKGMSKELADYRSDNGEEAIWTNGMFGGMPGYMISVLYPSNLAQPIHKIFTRLFHPASALMLYILGFYILLLSLGVGRWKSLVGAIAFGFSSYFLIILSAGHNSKAYALGYLPLVIAGVLMVFNKKRIQGVLLFALALSLELLAGHPQITYYGLILIAIYGLVELVFAIKEKTTTSFFKSTLFLFVGAIVAVGMNFSRLYTSWEYSKETIRGPSELTSNNTNKTSGLDKDYVVQWSYGIGETFTLLVPNFKGGASQISADENSKSYEALHERGIQNPRQVVGSVVMYHGDQPSTAGPVYVGAIVVFLFFLGLFVVKGRYKWWLLIATIVSIVLSWGGNVMGLTSFLLDYLPLYNKFRAPSMTLVIAQIAMPLLGFIALNEILTGKTEKKEWLNGLKWAAIITGGLSLLFAAAPGITGDFSSPYDLRQQFPDWLIDSAVADRKAALSSDALRSFLFIAMAAGVLFLWHLKKIKTNLFIGLLGLLILIDLWSVDKRYLNNGNFVSKREAANPFPEMPADRAILQDKDLNYRVLPLQNPFMDARASYYHKNVGGYHAAKLRRYQEVIENHLSPEMQVMVTGLQSGSAVDSVFGQTPVINMLNTRYIIYDLNQGPIRNPLAFGNAWFVNDYKIVENADEEIAALKRINPALETTIDKRFSGFVDGKKFNKDLNGNIELIEYEPNYLKYKAKTSSEQLAVFSEIYYDKGWNAFIDGEKVPHFRVNYILRAMILPAGEHIVEFKFEPKSYFTGNKISFASSILLMLAIAGYAFSEFRKTTPKKIVKK